METKKEIETPIIEAVMYMSLDRKWFIHKTIITDIKPVNHIKRVLEEINYNMEKEKEEDQE